MSYNPENPNGQATSANSKPVVVASDQSALPQNLTEINGNAVSTAANGVQKIGVADSSGNALTSTASALDVNIKSGAATSAATADESAWTAGTSTFAPTGGVFNDSAAALTSGQEGTTRLTNNRGLHANLRNSAGTEIATSGNPVRIDPTGTTTQPVSGTVTTAPPSNASTNIAQVGGASVALGNTTMSASLPVTLASNDTNTTPFVTSGGGGYVRQDSTATIAKESGGNLATLAGAVSAGKMNVNLSSGANTIGNVEITDGTNTANVQTGDQNGLVVNNNNKTINFSTSVTGVQTLLANTDCRGYSYITIVVQSVGTSLTWNGQWSPTSGGTYASYNVWTTVSSASNNPYNGLTVGTGIVTAGIYGDFFEIVISAMTGGTTSGYAILSSLPRPATAISGIVGTVSTNVTGTITTAASTVSAGTLQAYSSGFVPVSVHGAYAGVSFSITTSDDNGTTLYNTAVFNSTTASWIAPGATITPGTNASLLLWVPIAPNSSGSLVKITASAYTSGTANIHIGAASGTTHPGSHMSQIMDSAGNARGANVDASSNLNTRDVASSATGSAVPANAVYIAGTGTSGNLTGIQTGSAMADAASGLASMATAQYIWNGSSFDRTREANGATGTTGTGLLGAGAMGIYNTSAPTASNGDYYQLQLDSSANLKVNVAAGSGFTVQPGNTPNTTPWLMSLQPATAGGWSVSSQTALTNTVVSVKSSAGQLGGYMMYNPNPSACYVQVFNVASGSVTLGTTAPTYVVSLPGNAAANIEMANGIAHSTAICVAATTTATGSTAPATALTGFFLFK